MSAGRFARVALLAVCAVPALAIGCKTHESDHAASPSATAAAPSASIAAPVAKPKPWFSGSFQGDFEAKLAPVEVKLGAVREWGSDDGKSASGPGKLELKIDDDGHVEGGANGALGESHASGKVEDDTLRVVLAPNDTSGLHGVLVATKDGAGFRGTIKASSGDSLKVRQADVELKKQPN